MKAAHTNRHTADQHITVSAPARLHLGFLDLNGDQGRKFGSIGLAIDSHHTRIRISQAQATQIHGDNLSDEFQQRLIKTVTRFYQSTGKHIPATQQTVKIEVLEYIPEHAGFGSGTQLALVVGTALARWHNLTLATPDLAQQANRGKRSGIGIATFDHGGFVVDGGLKDGQIVPPLLMHHAYPKDWRIVLIMDRHHQGMHGSNESQAFKQLPVFPLEHSQRICHLTLMQLLPALVEQDLPLFGEAITNIQALIGDHFASAQGGRYSSQSVANCLRYAQQAGFSGIAQSSWGPTGCVFVESQHAAEQLCSQLQNNVPREAGLEFIIAAADNRGAIIETR